MIGYRAAYVLLYIVWCTLFNLTTCFELEQETCSNDEEDWSLIPNNNSSQVPPKPIDNDDDLTTHVECVNGTKHYGCRVSSILQANKTVDDSIIDPSQVIDFGSTVIVGQFLFLCQKRLPSINQTIFVTIGCYVDQVVLAPGQTYRNGTEYYECTKSDTDGEKTETELSTEQDQWSVLRLEKRGCIDHYQQLVPVGKSQDVDGVRYKCIIDETSGKFSLQPVACLVDDTAYKVGDIIVISIYWYVCKPITQKSQNGEHNSLAILPGGCIVDFFLIRIGGLFHSKGNIGKCELVDDPLILGSKRIRVRTIGCLGKSVDRGAFVEHLIDDKWLEPEATGAKQNSTTNSVNDLNLAPVGTQFLVEMACIQLTSNRAAKIATRCAMTTTASSRDATSSTREPRYLVPNCFRRINRTTLWSCTKTAAGRLKSRIVENASMQDTADAIMAGLQYC